MIALLSLVSCITAEPQCRAEVEAWEDADGDGYGQQALGPVCALADGQVDRPLDCDDGDPGKNPEAAERCDGIDNDCDGEIDEDAGLRQFWTDADGDGFGGRFPSQLACEKPGPEWVANGEDCDDADAAVNPDAQEVCGRVDEDCDGYVDESDDSVDPASFSTFFRDADGDGYGDPEVTTERCRLAPGWVLNADDCNDATQQVTRIDWYTDADGDGYGDPTTQVYSCTRPPDAVRNAFDCDDTVREYNIDRNWYEDLDQDGYGDGAVLAVQCTPPADGTVPQNGDCDEADPSVHPLADDPCFDGLDTDCDGSDLCRTCGEYLAHDPSSPSGVYELNLPSGDFDVFCDMTTDGGGWTLVASTIGIPPDDEAGPWHDDLATIKPALSTDHVWDGLRPVITGDSDIRFACRQTPNGPFSVDLTFYDIHWYREITTGSDAASCFNEADGAGYDTPAPARRNNLTGAELPEGDDWNSGFLEGEDTCGSNDDFAIDFDNRGLDGAVEATDWGESNFGARCGGFGGTTWFVFVRE